jgi:hypothetical protein
MRVLALDASTKSGWAIFSDGKLTESGQLEQVSVENFNVNDDPNKQPIYPHNILEAAEKIGRRLQWFVKDNAPDIIVVENTVRGKNRHTQRLLEWIHLEIVRRLRNVAPIVYMDPSEWRAIVEMRLSKDDKKNNRDVSKGKKRGRIGKKHLSVRMVNERFQMSLKLKDNDRADAILLGLAYVTRSQKT